MKNKNYGYLKWEGKYYYIDENGNLILDRNKTAKEKKKKVLDTVIY